MEAVLFGDFAALVSLAADDKDGLVVLGQSAHGGVRLDELVGGDGVLEDLGELLASGGLRLARAVGEENVGNLDAELIVSIQDLENTLALGNEAVTVDESTLR